MAFQAQKLYGGAVATSIPTGLLDASQVRQIPDTQEVFVNMNNPSLSPEDSLIFDLLEMVEASDDAGAVKMHLDEISQLNGLVGDAAWKLLESQDISSKLRHFTKSTSSSTKGYVAVAAAPAQKWGKDKAEWVVLILGLIRHIEKDVDILISVNLPSLSVESCEELRDIESSDNEKHKRIKAGKDIVIKAMENYEILDGGLFG
ncbi:Ran GTPase-binding protein [Saccharomycopsis crataegensis]|uniref:Ran GTPase-binding protein n=1 Tax=Saccharomycopsis crataegensis TaxID=43959 RepID=A0AAV5QFH3_9ASCO|nr:Ran GTPase-binding protein [Saccharomycopsis crataegensis]